MQARPPPFQPTGPSGGAVFVREVASRVEEVEGLTDAMAAWARARGVGPGVMNSVALVLDELFSNIVIHGYRRDPTGRIEVQARIEGGAIGVVLTDQATPFNPLQVPEPDTGLPLERRPMGGLGLLFVRRIADSFDYQLIRSPGTRARNEVRFTKRLVEETAPA